MKVLLLGNYPPDAQESMQKFAAVLLRGLQKADTEAELLQPTPVFGALRPARSGVGKWLGYLDKFFVFPTQLTRRLRAAAANQLVVHLCDHSQAYYTRWLQRVPHLVTCHDVLAIQSARDEVPENPTRWSGRRLQGLIVAGLERARHVACVSDHTRAELFRLTRVCESRVSVCHNGLNYPFTRLQQTEAQPMVERLLKTASVRQGRFAAQGLARPFLLHVGGDAWYKNRIGVLHIFANLCRRVLDPPFLVMAGKPLEPQLKAFITLHQLDRLVSSLTDCDDAELCALYSSAELLLFPSLAEGFGWPIIEAQACGCRVVTSRRQPMIEVAGDAAFWCEPADSFRAAKIVCEALEESLESRERRIQAGLRNAARFSTEKMIENYLGVYQRVTDEGSDRGVRGMGNNRAPGS
ncbi:MAG: glycosyltransferase family 4 protein [Verrucomicrobiales bacterium]|nr:glycosyltransferase family 4 protein [Verrucomicrobiales bacterium]